MKATVMNDEKMPDKIYATEVNKNTVYMNGSSPVVAYDRQITHPRRGLATEYIRADLANPEKVDVEGLKAELYKEIPMSDFGDHNAIEKHNDLVSEIVDRIASRGLLSGVTLDSVIVPRIPSDAMIKALMNEWDSTGGKTMADNYKAMIEASRK